MAKRIVWRVDKPWIPKGMKERDFINLEKRDPRMKRYLKLFYPRR